MATKDELVLWVEGVEAYRKGDLEGALACFEPLVSFSKVAFNVGMIYSRLDDHRSADAMYSAALAADNYLAVAFLQKGYAYFMLEDYGRAERCYNMVLELLLENDFIDYTQLGLKYRLYRCEVHFNRAMCYQLVGDRSRGMQDIATAQKLARTPDHNAVIATAARSGLDELTLFTVPFEAIFEVPESKTKNIEKRSFLKDAKVVASTDMEIGTFAGFSGAAILEPSLAATDESGDMGASQTLFRRKTEKKSASPESSSPAGFSGGRNGSVSGGSGAGTSMTISRSQTSYDRPSPNMSTLDRSNSERGPSKPSSIGPAGRRPSTRDDTAAKEAKLRARQSSLTVSRQPQQFSRPNEPMPDRSAANGRAQQQQQQQRPRQNSAGDGSYDQRRRLSEPEAYESNNNYDDYDDRRGYNDQGSAGGYNGRSQPAGGQQARGSPLPRDPFPEPNGGAKRGAPYSSPKAAGAGRYNDDQYGNSDGAASPNSSTTKVKIHFEGQTIAMIVPVNVDLGTFRDMIRTKQGLSADPQISYPDEEDPDTMISVIDDDDLYLAMSSASGATLHFYCKTAPVSNDLLDYY